MTRHDAPAPIATPAELRSALEKLGVGVNELAQEIGINSRTLARMADDRGDGPSPPVWYIVQAALRGEIRRPLFLRRRSLD
jgi:hypothetical protein